MCLGTVEYMMELMALLTLARSLRRNRIAGNLAYMLRTVRNKMYDKVHYVKSKFMQGSCQLNVPDMSDPPPGSRAGGVCIYLYANAPKFF